MPDNPTPSHDAVTTPLSATANCPQCGVALDPLTMSCGACGAVITSGGEDGGRGERVRLRLQDAIGDSFTLGDLLGRGGMGIVFRAREKALDRDVALKVLAFDPVLNPEAYERFEREARLAAKLDHPNIVPIFAVGQRNGVAYYTMRLVKGGNVEQRVTRGQGFDLPYAVAVLRDVASALDYAHANGVVHRDIKPANILIGDSGHAMVADFGIARAFGGDANSSVATRTGVVGSPAYMSPEQWRGEKVEGKADQYALGILAFELLTGRRPFADASMQELLRMHLTEDPPDVDSFRDDLPGHLTGAIWRAMSKDPANRYPTATAFVDALAGEAAALEQDERTGAGRRSSSRASVPRLTRTLSRSSAPTLRGPPLPGTTAAAAPVHASARSFWLIAVLLLLVGGLGGMLWVGARRPAQSVAATPVPVTASADSFAAFERAQNEESDRQKAEIADLRRIALEAESKVEQLQAAQRRSGGRSVAPVIERHGHLFVMARGGTPAVFVDGTKVAAASPAVIEVIPGHHVITVQGGAAEFEPAEYNLDVAARDTMNVTFMSKQMAQRLRQRLNGRVSPVPDAAAAAGTADGASGLPPVGTTAAAPDAQSTAAATVAAGGTTAPTPLNAEQRSRTQPPRRPFTGLLLRKRPGL